MPMPPTNLEPELALLARMKRGDESAFVALYRRHRDAVYRLALLYGGSAAGAADATQEAFVFFMTRPGAYDPARGTLAAWLCGVARNLVRKQLSGREDATDPARFDAGDAACDAQGESETPLTQVLRDEAAEEVRRALAQLAPHYRDVLILCELSELSYAEAAQVCGIDIGTVRSRLSRARAQLAQRLAAHAPGRDAGRKEAMR
jgi:RNA polymerase sigma-70 factor (ECF subfamily)